MAKAQLILVVSIKNQNFLERLLDFSAGAPRPYRWPVVQEASRSKKKYMVIGEGMKWGQDSKAHASYFVLLIIKATAGKKRGNSYRSKTKVLMGASADAIGSMHIIDLWGSDELLFNQTGKIMALKNNPKRTNDSIRQEFNSILEIKYL